MEVECIETYCGCKQMYHLKDAKFCSRCGTEIGLINGFASAEERDAFLLKVLQAMDWNKKYGPESVQKPKKGP